MNWMRGYYIEDGYTYNYHKETSPSWLRWVALLKGVSAPAENFRFLDLGCGQGNSLITMAAHHPESEFIGIDFYPQHISHARYLASSAGLTNVRFIEADFLELSHSPKNLGEFDFVIAHGITSWVSEEVRQAVFKIASCLLKPGGLMYNSYNAYPGKFSIAPFQKLVSLIQESTSGRRGLELASEIVRNLSKAKAGVFQIAPELESHIASIGKADISYLLQEYCNANWTPLFSSDVLKNVSEFKLNYLGSATIPEQFDQNYPDELVAVFGKEEDICLKELLRDLSVGQGFRRDVYVKGARPFFPNPKKSIFAHEKLVKNPLGSIPGIGDDFIFSGVVQIKISRDIVLPILDSFGPNGSTFDEAYKKNSNVSMEYMLRTVSLFLQSENLLFQSEADSSPVKYLNRAVLSAISEGAPYNFLTLGSAKAAVRLNKIDSLLLDLMRSEERHFNDADFVSRFLLELKRLNLVILDNGVPVEDKNKAVSLAENLINDFKKQTLPIFESMNAI